MAAIVKVTRGRLQTQGTYRLQLNAEKKAVALLYGPLAEYYGAKRIAAARNRMAIAATKAIQGDFAQAAVKDPVFAKWLREVFLTKYVDAEMQDEAVDYWQVNGFEIEEPRE